MGCLRGRRGRDMRGNMLWIKKKEMGYFLGLMEGYMQGSGKMENSMEGGCIQGKMELPRKEFGLYCF